MVIDLNAGWRAGQQEAAPWYCLPRPGSLELPACEAAGRYAQLLSEAVCRHGAFSGPVGVTLSGGIDSASVACLLRDDKNTNRSYWALTACYDEPDLDERNYLEAVLRTVRFQSVRVFPTPGTVEHSLSRLIWHMDEPFGGTSVAAQWCVFEAAREHGVRVVLGGQGADEQLAGYHHMLAVRRRELKARRNKIAEGSIWAVPRSATAEPPQLRAPRWLHREWHAVLTEQPGKLERLQANLGDMCQFLLVAGSLPMLLRFEDRNSMAHGIEARVPFLDRAVVEFAIALGSKHKVSAGQGKHLLRLAMRNRVPNLVIRRKRKVGFTAPEQRWILDSLWDRVSEGAREVARRMPSYIVASEVDNLLSASVLGDAAHALQAWRFYAFGEWVRQFNVKLV